MAADRRCTRVLLLDVHEEVRRLLRDRLAAQAGFGVVSATGDPAEAVELSTKLQPDILLVDIRQLEDAPALCRSLLRAAPGAMLVVLSSFVHAWERPLYESLGASVFLNKEGGFSTLLEALQRLIETRLDDAI